MIAFVDSVRLAIKAGIIGDESVPYPSYWHWPVLKPEMLPPYFIRNYNRFGEIRWYSDED